MRKGFLFVLLPLLLACLLLGCSKETAISTGPIDYLKDLGKDCGYENAFSELTEVDNIVLEDAGFLRLQQNYRGLPIYGRTVVYVTDAAGEVMTIASNALDVDESLDLEPAISPDDAIELALACLGNKDAKSSEAELYIYNLDEDGVSHLAYVFNAGVYEFVVDAHNGEILLQNCRLQTTGDDTEEPQSATTYPFDSSSDSYTLYDSERNIIGSQATVSNVTDTNQFTTYTWSEGETPDPDLYSAYTNTRLAYLFFEEVLNHPAPDGHGNAKTIVATGIQAINDEDFSDDAGGDGIPSEMLATIVVGKDKADWAHSLDIIAHEYTHCVENYHSAMNYSGESGAIMEALSDIFGELVEGWYKQQQDNTAQPDWDNGDRNLASPELSDNPREYYGEHWDYEGTVDKSEFVHDNSTVISHTAYLMSTSGGGTLSIEQLANLWYRAMLMMPKNCSFYRCRECVEWASMTMTDLSPEDRILISKAFDEVGIGETTVWVDVDGQLAVLDRVGDPYDDYIIEIWKYKSPIFTIGPKELIDTVEVSSFDPFTLHYDPGAYYVEITDGRDHKKTVAFPMILGKESPWLYEVDTNFGPITIGGEVRSLEDNLVGVAVTMECGGESFHTQTDDDGTYSFPIDEDIRQVVFTFYKEGFPDLTCEVTLEETDFYKKQILLDPVYLKHPYATVVENYMKLYGTPGFGSYSDSSYYHFGVFYLDLLDFDGDGQLELVVGYGVDHKPLASCSLAIWTVENNEAKFLYSDDAMHGSDISQWFQILEKDGKWYVASGWDGYECDVEYYGLTDGKFKPVVSFGYAYPDDMARAPVYTVNGETVSESVYSKYYQSWYQPATQICYLYTAFDKPFEWTMRTDEVLRLLLLDTG